MDGYILPDGKEAEQIGISKYIRNKIDTFRESVLPDSATDLEVIEYLLCKIPELEDPKFP